MLADVGLDLDDPSPPPGPSGRLVDEVDAQERPGDLERRPRKERRRFVQERVRKNDWRSPGMNNPNTFMKPGISRERMSSAVADVS